MIKYLTDLSKRDSRPEIQLLCELREYIVNFNDSRQKELQRFNKTFFLDLNFTSLVGMDIQRDRVVLGLPGSGGEDSIYSCFEKTQLYFSFIVEPYQYLFITFKNSVNDAEAGNSLAIAIPVPAKILERIYDIGRVSVVNMESDFTFSEANHKADSYFDIEVRKSKKMIWEA